MIGLGVLLGISSQGRGSNIASMANRYGSIIALENPSYLRDTPGRALAPTGSYRFYRRIQFTIAYRLLRVIEVQFIDSKSASSICPRCGGRLRDTSGMVMRCTKRGFKGGRDVIACANLFIGYPKHFEMLGFWGVPERREMGERVMR